MRDPEALFYEIAQSNEVLRSFKFHSLRVMYLSSMLASRTGDFDEDLRIAAMLHDIGKIGVAKEILFKPGKLNDMEYIIIQSHCHIGNLLVRKKLGLERAAEFIRDHHERWDGTGYPRGLKGEEISIQGRIIGIADAFDTMTIERRLYQQRPLSNEEALAELIKCSWTQFDGDLVDAFVDMMKGRQIPDFLIDRTGDKDLSQKELAELRLAL